MPVSNGDGFRPRSAPHVLKIELGGLRCNYELVEVDIHCVEGLAEEVVETTLKRPATVRGVLVPFLH